jgi:hypothetical protein
LKELVQIDDSIFFVEKIGSNKLILDTFYTKGYIWRWLALYFSMYDEKEDRIILIKAFEV